MKIITINLNGVRSAARKDFFSWLPKQRADVICFQEVRAKVDQIPEEALALNGYHQYWHPAERPGYSGVALWSKHEPEIISKESGSKLMDHEGRYLYARINGYDIVSVYLPSGSSSEDRQEIKMSVLGEFMKQIKKLQKKSKKLVICGDFNIAHTKMDIKNWRGNQKNSGFLPEEREWLDQLIEQGFIDAFRHLHPKQEKYTWWSNRGKARENDVGWRIDYHFVSKELEDSLKSIKIYREKFYSDHAPQILTLS